MHKPMRIDGAIRARLEELIDRSRNLGSERKHSGAVQLSEIVPACNGWLASANHILSVVAPNPTSGHRIQALSASAFGSIDAQVRNMAGVLKALLEDVDAGVVTSIANAARGEVFDDFLDHAEHYLKGNKVQQAGVIAGVVFEDTIRRACERHQVGQKGIALDKLISELEKKELLTGVKAKRARAAAAVRTSATHAQWDEFERTDVESAIKTTRELIEQLITA